MAGHKELALQVKLLCGWFPQYHVKLNFMGVQSGDLIVISREVGTG
jgi:hypothetical protein